jgi:hypothetical protein
MDVDLVAFLSIQSESCKVFQILILNRGMICT